MAPSFSSMVTSSVITDLYIPSSVITDYRAITVGNGYWYDLPMVFRFLQFYMRFFSVECVCHFIYMQFHAMYGFVRSCHGAKIQNGFIVTKPLPFGSCAHNPAGSFLTGVWFCATSLWDLCHPGLRCSLPFLGRAENYPLSLNWDRIESEKILLDSFNLEMLFMTWSYFQWNSFFI